jgi:hypothetical protein
MATVSQLPASCNLVCTVGNDFTLTLAVLENSVAWVSTGATLSTDIYSRDGTVVATDFTTAATDGQVTLTLTDANTTTLGVGVYSYRLSVTKSGNTRDWIAGTLSVVEAGIGGTTSSAASLSITTGAVSLSTTTLVAPAAANISVADAGALYDGTTVEAVLQELPTLYSPWPRFVAIPGVATCNVESGSSTFLQSSSSYFGGYRSLINIADYVEWNVSMLAGSWSLDVEVVQATSGGTFKVEINGALVATIDTYNAGGGTNRITATGITITDPGVYPVRLTVLPKNVSSSSTICRVAGFALALPGSL